MRTLDHALLAARIMRPKRGDPWPVRKALRGISDPVEAWSALGGTLPLPVATQPARRFERTPFVLPAPGEPGRAPTPGRDVVETPPTLGACMAIALDPQGFLAAEEHARETLRRLAPWGVEMRARTLWAFVPAWPGAPQGGEHVLNAVIASLVSAPRDAKPKSAKSRMEAAHRDATAPVVSELSARGASLVDLKCVEPILDAIGFAAMWSAACDLELIAPRYEHAPGRFVAAAGTRFAELPDPFEPLLRVIELGYFVSGATEDAILLVATEPETTRR